MIRQERETLNELLLYHSNTIGAARLTPLALDALIQAFKNLKPTKADLMLLFEEVREAVRDSRPKPIPLIRLLRLFEREFLPFAETVDFEEQRSIAIRMLEDKKAIYLQKRDLVTLQGLKHLEDGDSIIVHSAGSVVTNILVEASRQRDPNFMVFVLQLDPVRTPRVAAALEEAGIPNLIVPVHDLCHYQGQANKIFVGALTITPDRKVVAPVGTANVLSICHVAGVESYLFANTLHYSLGIARTQQIDRTDFELEDPNTSFSVTSHSHDLVDLRLIDIIVNEYGVVPKDVVGPDGRRILDPHPLTD
jgi:translation initiation factor 2B subunit (eIF-2B alpha/beta/delta family)